MPGITNNGKIPAVSYQNGFEKQLGMIPKAYSEGVSVCSTKTRHTQVSYLTEYLHSSDVTYRTSVTFVSKFVPQHYVTTLTVDEDEQQCTTTYDITPFFIKKTIPDNLTVTKDLVEVGKHKVTTTLTRDPDYKDKRYTSGIDLEPVHVSEITIQQNGEILPHHEINICNGDGLHSPLLKGADDAPLPTKDKHVFSSSVITLMDSVEKTIKEGELWFESSGREKMFLMNNLY